MWPSLHFNEGGEEEKIVEAAQCQTHSLWGWSWGIPRLGLFLSLPHCHPPFRGRVSVPELRGIQRLKNSFGCFSFLHLTRKLKERQQRVEREKDVLLGHKSDWSFMSWNSLGETCPFMVRRETPESLALARTPSGGALEIPPRKTLCWIERHCSEWGQRITSFLCSWIYFRVMLTFTRTFT